MQLEIEDMLVCTPDIILRNKLLITLNELLRSKTPKPHAEIEISYAIKNYFVYDCFNSLFVFISR